ncbi:MAG: glycosyltransferase family 39 protein [Candidatus Hydrogenedentes bacterium]|nr:glycosyltransferase family 39 protein [Candidatus Hydrogenedentota bacterium]
MSLLALIAAAALSGWYLLRGFYARQDAEVWVLRLLTGFAACALLTLAAGACSLEAARIALYTLAALMLTLELGQWGVPQNSQDPSTHPPIRAQRPPLFDLACWIALGIGLALALTRAFFPANGFEAAAAHLALPQDYANAGRFFLDAGSPHAPMPHLLYTLYAVLYDIGGEGYVRLLNWVFLLLACGATWAIGYRVGGPRAGAIAAAILATTPAALSQVAAVDLDMPFTAFYLGGILAVFGWHRERRWTWLLLGAFLAGSACGIRAFGYALLPLTLLIVILPSQGQTRKASLVFLGAAILAAAPWFAWTLLATIRMDAPLSLATLLRGGSALPVQPPEWPGIVNFLKFPWDIVMRPQEFDGWQQSPGALVLALGLPGVLLGGPLCWVIGGYSMIGGMGAFFIERSAQFFLPLFAPLFALAGAAPALIGRLQKPALALVLVSLAFGLTLQATAVRQAWHTPVTPRAEAFARANTDFNTGATVLTFDPRTYYLVAPAWSRITALEHLAQLPRKDQINWLREHGIGYLFLPLDELREGQPNLSEELRHMIEAWRNDPAFVLDAAITIPRTGAEGVEKVELYVLDTR